MSKNSLILCIVYILFLLFGGIIFKYSQWEEIEIVVSVVPSQWISLTEILQAANPPADKEELSSLVAWLQHECSDLSDDTSQQLLSAKGNQSWMVNTIENRCQSIFENTDVRYEYTLSFIQAVFFSMTVTTTIGYGYVVPYTKIGRILCMLYAIVGIPLTMMLLAWTSEFFGQRLFDHFKSKVNAEKHGSKLFIAIGTTIYLNVGFLVFIFLPAILFTYVEHWSYLNSVYFAFISLTTIGFGDLVTGTSVEGVWLYVYQIFVIFWILTGLGYWVVVANFITKAMNSQKLAEFAKRFTDVKKIMTQVGLTQDDPQFVSHTSKSTLNFMLQLSNAMVNTDSVPDTGTLSPASSSPVSPISIPGIAALFGKAGTGTGEASLFTNKLGIGLFSPMQKTNFVDTAKTSPESIPKQNLSEEEFLNCEETSLTAIETENQLINDYDNISVIVEACENNYEISKDECSPIKNKILTVEENIAATFKINGLNEIVS